MISSIMLVIGFKSSSALAAAYGVAVTTDMVFTTILFAVVAYSGWKWRPARVTLMITSLLIVDLAFWGANMPKIPHGGWFPLLIASGMFVLMTTWKTGRKFLWQRLYPEIMTTSFFLGRERLISTALPGMARWRERLFAVMSRNAVGAVDYFCLPAERVIELGMQVEI